MGQICVRKYETYMAHCLIKFGHRWVCIYSILVEHVIYSFLTYCCFKKLQTVQRVLLHDMTLKTCVKNSCTYAVHAKPLFALIWHHLKFIQPHSRLNFFGSKLLLYGNSSSKLKLYWRRYFILEYSQALLSYLLCFFVKFLY